MAIVNNTATLATMSVLAEIRTRYPAKHRDDSEETGENVSETSDWPPIPGELGVTMATLMSNH